MAATPPLIRIRVGGNLYGDASWSIGLSFAATAPDLFEIQGDRNRQVAEGIRDRVAALNGGSIMPAPQTLNWGGEAVALNFLRVSALDAAQKETTVALLDKSPAIRGVGTSRLPAQSAMCVSLLTGRPGASYRGRVYFPALGVTLSSAGRVEQSVCGSLALGFSNWLNQLKGAIQGDGVTSATPVVVSTTRGTLTAITSVRVGNRLDSQRRRAESQEESYSVSPMP